MEPAEAGVEPREVVVIDIDIPFGSMVVLMVKWGIATIPAFLILLVLGGIVVEALLSFFQGLANI